MPSRKTILCKAMIISMLHADSTTSRNDVFKGNILHPPRGCAKDPVLIGIRSVQCRVGGTEQGYCGDVDEACHVQWCGVTADDQTRTEGHQAGELLETGDAGKVGNMTAIGNSAEDGIDERPVLA